MPQFVFNEITMNEERRVQRLAPPNEHTSKCVFENRIYMLMQYNEGASVQLVRRQVRRRRLSRIFSTYLIDATMTGTRCRRMNTDCRINCRIHMCVSAFIHTFGETISIHFSRRPIRLFGCIFHGIFLLILIAVEHLSRIPLARAPTAATKRIEMDSALPGVERRASGNRCERSALSSFQAISPRSAHQTESLFDSRRLMCAGAGASAGAPAASVSDILMSLHKRDLSAAI